MSVLTLDPFDHEERRERTLWTIAALAVAGLHVGLAVGYLLLRPVPQGRAEASAFDVVFTPAVVSEPAPAAQDAPAEPSPQAEPPKDEPVVREAVAEPLPQPAPPPDPEPQVTAPPEVIPQPAPVPQVALAPEPPRADDLVLPPPPPPKPIEAKPPETKPVAVPERVERKPVEKEKAEKKPVPPKPAAAPASRPARIASAPNPGEDSAGAREGQANWSSQVRANISRAAAYPSDGNGASGTATVSVVIDRNGRLVSRRLTRSSGSPALDRAALSMIERAAPFPRFPPVMKQAQEALNVPLSLRPR
ncbi:MULTISPECIES: TonB family protein [unclassified Bradyrhizobium]|uniref:TonB family protein n=1 Tax=unclassified Bradyrhizobium TaxID=2631580 RepID=UPI002917090C|nr:MULTISPECIES: TonB family protein [unclassified Bradyrhizobium]